jgi:hypothetical protein
LFSALAAAGALTPAEVVAANRPPRVLVRDARRAKSCPLPSIPGGAQAVMQLPA